MSETDESTEILIQKLDEQDPKLVRKLGGRGAGAAPAVPKLLTLGRHKWPELSSAAVSAIEEIGEAAVPYLITGLYSTNRFERMHAAEILGNYPERAAEALDRLVEIALSDESYKAVSGALRALRKMNEKGLVGNGVFIAVSKRPDAKARHSAYYSLCEIAERDSSVISLLARGLGDSAETRETVNRALKKLGERALPCIHEAIATGVIGRDQAQEAIKLIQKELGEKGFSDGVRKIPGPLAIDRALQTRQQRTACAGRIFA